MVIAAARFGVHLSRVRLAHVVASAHHFASASQTPEKQIYIVIGYFFPRQNARDSCKSFSGNKIKPGMYLVVKSGTGEEGTGFDDDDAT